MPLVNARQDILMSIKLNKMLRANSATIPVKPVLEI